MRYEISPKRRYILLARTTFKFVEMGMMGHFSSNLVSSQKTNLIRLPIQTNFKTSQTSNVSSGNGQKYFHNVGISIDFSVFSCLQENLSRFCWPTHSYAFGVIGKLND